MAPPPRVRRTHLRRSKAVAGQSKSARLAYDRMMAYAMDLEVDGITPYWINEQIPEAWDTLESDVDVEERKVRISLRLDESVAKFFRAMGPGYQTRINRILATFAQMRIAQINTIELRFQLDKAEREAREARQAEEALRAEAGRDL